MAIEGLKSLQQNSLIQTNPRRGFGAAMRAVVDFLDVFEDSLKNGKPPVVLCARARIAHNLSFSFVADLHSCCAVRVMAFLCGIPNHGDGKLEETSDLSPKTEFYREQVPLHLVRGSRRQIGSSFPIAQAKRAVEVGVCVDLFVVTNTFVGLSSLKFLTVLTGGNLLVYEEPEGATLPQDLYVSFLCPPPLTAFSHIWTYTCCVPDGVMQISAVYTPARVERFVPPAHFQRVQDRQCLRPLFSRSQARQHPPCPGLRRVQVLRLRLRIQRNQRGFCVRARLPLFLSLAHVRVLPTTFHGAAPYRKLPPTIQMAFAYTYIPSVYDEERTVIRRRLRLQTVQLPVVKDRLHLYNSADPYAILCLLTHKVPLPSQVMRSISLNSPLLALNP